MGCMPQQNVVAKGPILYCLDELSKKQDARNRLETLRTHLEQLETEGYQGLTSVLARYLFPGIYDNPVKVGKFEAYLDAYWFNEKSPTAEFRAMQPVSPVFTAGVINTIDLALDASKVKAIDSWWMVDHPRFEVMNFVSEQGVTLLLATPRPKAIVAQGILNADAEAWITNRSTGRVRTLRVENRPKPIDVAA